MVLTHPGGGVVAPAAGWQAPFRVITGSLIGTTLVLGSVAGGGGGGCCIGVAAGAVPEAAGGCGFAAGS